MDAKITKQRLARMLSYDWIKIIAVIAAGIFFWALVFTTSATRITPAQNFYVFNYHCNRTLSNKFHAHLDAAFENGLFSYEVLDYAVGDLVAAGDYTSAVLDARMSTSEGDVIFLPNIPDESYATINQETGEKVYTYTYLQSFVGTYSSVLYDLDDYFESLESYLNDCYGGDYKTGTLDEQKVKAAFRDRIEKSKDKRFKKQAQIAQGEEWEVARVQKYKAAWEEFQGYMQSGYVSLTSVEVKAGEEISVSGNYAINLCPDETANPYLKDYVSYSGENGRTAKDMQVLLFKFHDVDATFEFESVLYLNDLIKQCKAAQSAEQG